MKKSGKKLCALALAAAMLGLTACGSSSGTTDTTTAAAGGAQLQKKRQQRQLLRRESLFHRKQIL